MIFELDVNVHQQFSNKTSHEYLNVILIAVLLTLKLLFEWLLFLSFNICYFSMSCHFYEKSLIVQPSN